MAVGLGGADRAGGLFDEEVEGNGDDGDEESKEVFGAGCAWLASVESFDGYCQGDDELEY